MIPLDPWAPLGAALLAYHNGRSDAFLRIDSDVFDSEDVPVRHYYRPNEDLLPDLDIRALELCRGTILDVGAGAGRHALELQSRGMAVTALDISKDAVHVMRKRGINDARHGNIFNSDLGSFDTILLLMNGIGVAGNLEGLDRLFARFKQVVKPGGHVVFDASGLDPTVSRRDIKDLISLAIGRPQFGEVFFRLTFDTIDGSWYPWLFPAENLVSCAAARSGFDFRVVARGARGAYLAEAISTP